MGHIGVVKELGCIAQQHQSDLLKVTRKVAYVGNEDQLLELGLFRILELLANPELEP